MRRDPIEDARRAGLRVDIAPLGTWAPAALVAEYDRAERTIRVSATAVARIHTLWGEEEARSFLRAAVAHELYHHVACRSHGRSTHAAECERRAHRFARLRYGADPWRFERMLRSMAPNVH